MNAQIAKLYEIANKETRYIIGLMSGTSLDGLDIALCRVQGAGIYTQTTLERFITLPYERPFQEQVRTIFAKREIDQQTFSGLNALIGTFHGDLINTALTTWGIKAADIDLIASHGQTVYHAPQRLTKDKNYQNSTLQIGDGDHIAVKTGIITLSDFRQKQIAAGGEGAPLAAYGDFLLFTDDIENRILLNIGGISNFTFLPNAESLLEAYATDLGPGNTMMNQYMHQTFQEEMDKDAILAKQGTVHGELLAALFEEVFLSEDFPKTTGPELFNLHYLAAAQQRSETTGIAPQDVMATLNQFAAQAIVDGIKKATAGLTNVAIYISGGGLHNPLLVDNIKKGFPETKVSSFMDLGIDPDAKEACLFALLANETVAGSPDNLKGIKDSPAACMGKISFPY
ncbi:anhydro-N-acetylmuramic acid kinase [Sphingobacterium psychroaquaticum]|uniref:anhydro-N-acetylmuramic acid kinase n=1 Tax=Sphingobacterium psychroaquaticum TaxID=561061 RepID=UPI0010694EB9|nr:anhydro-N-acetylmuramic acid kinase [Sphingobacterium psychroaquaticum]QBQ42921.1 anhydro-N-acetylmuramic acid kinase [Sphingobacterium psychroaquaticum]